MKYSKWFFVALAVVFSTSLSAQTAAPAKGKAAEAPKASVPAQSNAGTRSLAGYMDEKGNLLGNGDTKYAFSKIDPQGNFTMTISTLYAYGDRPTETSDADHRRAEFSKNPEYFRGATVYVMALGNMYGDTGRLVQHVDTSRAIGKGVVKDNNSVDIVLNRGKFACWPTNFVLKRANGEQVWLGHGGWATSNKASGPYTVLVDQDGKGGDKRYPATVYCFDGDTVTAPSAAEKEKFAKYVQPPSFSSKEREAQVLGKDM